jgi:hypothetical protein
MSKSELLESPPAKFGRADELERIDDGGQRQSCLREAIMDLKKPGARLVLTMTALCLSLDASALFGGQVAPDAVGHAMCVLRPLAVFATFLFSNEWSQLVSEYCATFPREPAISIIALMLKISVVGLSLILTIAMLSLREEADGVEVPSEKHRVPISGLAGWIWVLGILFLPTILGWWFIASRSPREFRISIISKAYEDVLLLGLYIGGLILLCRVLRSSIVARLEAIVSKPKLDTSAVKSDLLSRSTANAASRYSQYWIAMKRCLLLILRSGVCRVSKDEYASGLSWFEKA